MTYVCRIGIIIQANRFARVCLEEALKYAHKRKTFGQRLIDHAVIRNKLAHMARNVEATHNWLENVTYQVKNSSYKAEAAKLGGPVALLKVGFFFFFLFSSPSRGIAL
jgi:alkylation response protein AidB-like acyl-CoA dehydrogenase